MLNRNQGYRINAGIKTYQPMIHVPYFSQKVLRNCQYQETRGYGVTDWQDSNCCWLPRAIMNECKINPIKINVEEKLGIKTANKRMSYYKSTLSLVVFTAQFTAVSNASNFIRTLDTIFRVSHDEERHKCSAGPIPRLGTFLSLSLRKKWRVQWIVTATWLTQHNRYGQVVT